MLPLEEKRCLFNEARGLRGVNQVYRHEGGKQEPGPRSQSNQVLYKTSLGTENCEGGDRLYNNHDSVPSDNNNVEQFSPGSLQNSSFRRRFHGWVSLA